MTTSTALTAERAAQILREGAGAVPVVEGGVDRMKKLHRTCLQEGIPAALARPTRRGGG